MAKKTGELQSILGKRKWSVAMKHKMSTCEYSTDEHVRMEENRQRSAVNLERLVGLIQHIKYI